MSTTDNAKRDASTKKPRGKALVLPPADELDILINQLIAVQASGVRVATGNVGGDFIIRLHGVTSEKTAAGTRLIYTAQPDALPLREATA